MFECFKHRSTELERLDTGDYTSEEYTRWQSEMRWIHGFLGEKRAIKNSLIRDIENSGIQAVSIVDVGAGSGGILKMVKDLLPDRRLFLIAAEMSDDAIATVRNESSLTGITPFKCDGLKLPMSDDSVDYAICTLTLHHLVDEDAMRLIGEMKRVSRKGFYVIDLHRHPVGYWAYRMLSSIFLQRFTQEDGALSILRSYTPGELMDLARKAGVSEPRVEHSRANRLILSGK